ncbi:hypothetical protein KBB08_01485 [Candidatus Gracilibacteria bacterium]|nr:hypothetical protein [Candidatus Gracilibacteria bacterium]
MSSLEFAQFEAVERLYGVQERCVLQSGGVITSPTLLATDPGKTRQRQGYIVSCPDQHLIRKGQLRKLLRLIPRDAVVFFPTDQLSADQTTMFALMAEGQGCGIDSIEGTTLQAIYRKRIAQVFVTHGQISDHHLDHRKDAYEHQLALIQKWVGEAGCQIVSDWQWSTVYSNARVSLHEEDHFLRHAIRQSVGILVLDGHSNDENAKRCKQIAVTAHIPFRVVLHGPEMNYLVPYTHFEAFDFDTFAVHNTFDWRALKGRLKVASMNKK